MALTGGFSGGAPICAKHGYAYLQGNRQSYLKACTAAFTLVAVNRATVTTCNAAHQREAQSGTAGRFTRPFQAIKRLEYARTFRLGHARAAVAYGQGNDPVFVREGNVDRGCFTAMMSRVFEQVSNQPA